MAYGPLQHFRVDVEFSRYNLHEEYLILCDFGTRLFSLRPKLITGVPKTKYLSLMT